MCGGGWCGRGTSRFPCHSLRLRRLPARRPRPARGPSPASAACQGAAAWPVGAVAQLAGAAVSSPCALSPPPSAAAAAPGEAPGACFGATTRAGGAPRAAVGAAAQLAGAAVSAPCAPGAPSRGVAAGLAAWAAGPELRGWCRPLGRWPGVGGGCPGLLSWRPDRHRSLRQPPLLALREGLPRISRGDRGAGAGPAVLAVVSLGKAIGVRHHCSPGRHARWQVRPSHYLPMLCCAVGSAVQCPAGEGLRALGLGVVGWCRGEPH